MSKNYIFKEKSQSKKLSEYDLGSSKTTFKREHFEWLLKSSYENIFVPKTIRIRFSEFVLRHQQRALTPFNDTSYQNSGDNSNYVCKLINFKNSFSIS